MAATTDRQE